LLYEGADPDAFGGGFAEMNAAGISRDGERHGLVVFALVDAQARARAKVKSVEKFQESRVAFVDAQNFAGPSYLDLGEPEGAVLAAKMGHPAKERDTMRAAAIAAEAIEQESNDLGGDAVLEAFSFLMRAGPFETDHFGEKFFGEAMPEDQMLRGSLPLRGEFDAAVAAHAEITAASHALQRGRDGGRRDTEVLGQARADGDLLLLDKLPDGFEVVFLRNAGFFAAHVRSLASATTDAAVFVTR
jgi:hypothetical protein